MVVTTYKENGRADVWGQVCGGYSLEGPAFSITFIRRGCCGKVEWRTSVDWETNVVQVVRIQEL